MFISQPEINVPIRHMNDNHDNEIDEEEKLDEKVIKCDSYFKIF